MEFWKEIFRQRSAFTIRSVGRRAAIEFRESNAVQK